MLWSRSPERHAPGFLPSIMRSKFPPVIALLPLLFAACSREPATPPVPPPPAVSAIALEAQPVTLTRELPGRSTAFLVAEVRPQVTGLVRQRLFTEGGMVEAGQPLYQLDDSTYRADFNRATAALTRAEAAAHLARLNADRAAGLAVADAVSRQENENAIAVLAQAEAEVAVAQAAVVGAETVLGYSTIRSPIAGRIGRSTITQGALVTANQTAPLATVQQLDPIYVDVTQSSRELLEMRRDFAAGTVQRPEEIPVTIILEDGTEYRHPGRLEFAEVSVDPTTGSYALRVLVPNPDGLLLPGMYVRAILTIGLSEHALLVPQRAVTRDPRGNTSVMLVGPDNLVEQRSIQVSRTVGDAWLVDSGLAVGDRVIVAGLQKIRPGIAVQITDAAPASTPAASAANR